MNANSARQTLWKQAAAGRNGAGLEQGPDLHMSLALLRRWRKLQDERVPVLETVLAGGCWSDARVAAAFADGTTCPACGTNDTGDLHHIWECPATLAIDRPEVQDTNRYAGTAAEMALQFPSAWLRGLFPCNYVKISSPVPAADDLVFYGDDLPDWAGGTYYSDGSGGVFGSVPMLRRVGLGIAKLRPGLPLCLSWGATGCVPNSAQTVPRAELLAVVRILQNVAHEADLDIVSDSLITVAGYNRTGERQRANEDLWLLADELLSARRAAGSSTVVRWIKAHAAAADIAVHGLLPRDVAGNYAADVLANKAAAAVQVWAQDAAAYFYCLRLARQIQERIVAIVLHNSAARVKADRPQQPRPFGIHGARLASVHSLVILDGKFRCTDCLRWEPEAGKAAAAWHKARCEPHAAVSGLLRQSALAGPRRLPPQLLPYSISGKSVPAGHDLFCYRGLIFCMQCGCWSTARILGLSGECLPSKSRHSEIVVSRILRGMKPSGLKAWPDEVMQAGGALFAV